MRSLKEIYRIGYGPSSSHTMGPTKAAEIFLKHNDDANCYRITLYGSLAATGKGHLTDVAVESIFRKAGFTLKTVSRSRFAFASTAFCTMAAIAFSCSTVAAAVSF